MQIRVPNELMLPEVIRQLVSGKEVVIRAAGRSMCPYIRDRKDELVLARISDTDIAEGEVVLALDTAGHYVVHRIIHVDGNRITLRGDGNPVGTETCLRQNVYGLLVAVVRDGKRTDCRTPKERRKAAVMRFFYIYPRKLKYKLAKGVKRFLRSSAKR